METIFQKGGRSTWRIGDTWYSLVVAQGALTEPLVLLTTVRVMTSEDAGRVVDMYLDRWGVEEANRFTKQGFDLENVRALTWTGLKRMVQFVNLAYGFLAILVHGPRKQVEHVAASFKAFGPVPTYLRTSTIDSWRALGGFYGRLWTAAHEPLQCFRNLSATTPR